MRSTLVVCFVIVLVIAQFAWEVVSAPPAFLDARLFLELRRLTESAQDPAPNTNTKAPKHPRVSLMNTKAPKKTQAPKKTKDVDSEKKVSKKIDAKVKRAEC